MIVPGILGSGQYYSDGASLDVVKSTSTTFTWGLAVYNNSTPDDTHSITASLTDSSVLMIGAMLWDVSNQNVEITDIQIDGVSVSNFYADNVNFTNGTESLAGAVGTFVPVGKTSFTIEPVLNDTTGAGFVYLWYAIFDTGNAPGYFKGVSDNTANATTQQVLISDLGADYSGGLVIAGFEDNSDNSTTVTLSTNTISGDKVFTEESNVAESTGFIAGAGITNGLKTDHYVAGALPNNPGAGDVGLMLCLAAHNRPIV